MKRYFTPETYSRKIKTIYRRYATERAFLVAGLGRCGTTMLYRSLINSGLTAAEDFIVDLDKQSEFRGGYVYKTHDYPPTSLPDTVKVIYLFRNPMNIAISAHKLINQWGEIHHNHLHSADKFRFNNDVLVQDTLNLEKQFDAWYKAQPCEFISIKYESLYDQNTIKMLNNFLGIKIKFDAYRRSTTSYESHPYKEELLRTYGSLNDKIQAAEECRVWHWE